MYAIDPHTGAPEHRVIFRVKHIWTLDAFKENIKNAGIQEFVTPVVDRSENVAKTWDLPISLLWIDGAHAYEAAKLDSDSWFPHLMEGGVIAYHDSTFGGVRRVVKRYVFFSPHFREVKVVDSITFATKINPGEQTFFDAFHSRYVYALSGLYALRHIPLPTFMRAPLKALFRRIVNFFS